MLPRFPMHRRAPLRLVPRAVTSARFARRPALMLAIAAVVVGSVAVDAAARLDVATQVSLLPKNMLMLEMSCPSADLCVAEGDAGLPHGNSPSDSTMYSTDPGVGSSWRPLDNPSSPRQALGYQIICPSTRLCLDVGEGSANRPDGQVFAIRSPGQRGARWELVGGGYASGAQAGDSAALSCPTAGFCGELEEDRPTATGKVGGVFWVSAHPGTPGSWHRRPLPSGNGALGFVCTGGLECGGGLVCASQHMCLAVKVSKHGSRLMIIRDPLNSGSRWQSYDLPLLGHDEFIQSASCIPSGGCVIFVLGPHGRGSILTSPNVEDGSSTWTGSYKDDGIEFALFKGVRCFTNGSCYMPGSILSAHGRVSGLLVSADPFKGAPWQSGIAPGTTTCATPRTCFALIEVRPFTLKHAQLKIETINLTG